MVHKSLDDGSLPLSSVVVTNLANGKSSPSADNLTGETFWDRTHIRRRTHVEQSLRILFFLFILYNEIHTTAQNLQRASTFISSTTHCPPNTS